MHMSQKPSQENPAVVHQSEMEWYANVYQGDRMPQLTVRAVIMGSLLGRGKIRRSIGRI